MMSALFLHALPRRKTVAAALWTALCASACSASPDEATNGVGSGGSSPFGPGANLFERDASSGDDSPRDGGTNGVGELSLRFVHAIVNLGALRVCYVPDPDRDTPAAARDDAIALPLQGTFGQVSEFALVAGMNRGYLTLHRVSESVPAGDAGVHDASIDPDSGDDAGSDADGGLDEDRPPSETESPCSLASQIAQLSLEVFSAEAARSSSQKESIGRRARTLVAAGIALDETRLEERRAQFVAEFLAREPNNVRGAEIFASEEIGRLRTTYGPQLKLLEATSPPKDGSFSLSVIHGVPDVLSANLGPGGIRLCVTAGTLENAVEPPLTQPPFAFGARSEVAPMFSPDAAYRFRIFSSARFDATDTASLNQDCATTSLTPLAELRVLQDSMAAGRAFSLLFVGAISPNALCAPVDPQAIIQPGCPYAPEDLTARLQLLPAE